MRYEDINVNNSFVSTILEIHVTKENDKKKTKKKTGRDKNCNEAQVAGAL